jgi:uncharacterized protein YndB with AHSA1/START domain
VAETNPTTTTRELIVTRVFDAPVARVWRAWTEPEQVMRWWGPTGFTCPVARMDVRVGGMSLVAMRAPAEFGGQDMYNTWTYTAIVPLERLEYILRFADQDGQAIDPAALGLPPGVPSEVPHVLTLKDRGNGTTRLTITEYGYTSEQGRDLSRAGLEQCLDKLATALAAA